MRLHDCEVYYYEGLTAFYNYILGGPNFESHPLLSTRGVYMYGILFGINLSLRGRRDHAIVWWMSVTASSAIRIEKHVQ